MTNDVFNPVLSLLNLFQLAVNSLATAPTDTPVTHRVVELRRARGNRPTP